MSLIEITNLDKTYNTNSVPVRAIKNVNLKIEKKEFTAIVGPSGSGKTTLLNIIGGLDSPTSGTIKIDNTDISNLSSGEMVDYRLQNIGFVFQAYNLIPVLTAKENRYPHETKAQVSSDPTCSNSNLSVVSPKPSWPLSLLPAAQRVPSDLMASVW